MIFPKKMNMLLFAALLPSSLCARLLAGTVDVSSPAGGLHDVRAQETSTERTNRQDDLSGGPIKLPIEGPGLAAQQEQGIRVEVATLNVCSLAEVGAASCEASDS